MANTREQLIEELVPKMKRAIRIGKLTSYPFKEHSLHMPHVGALFHIAKEKDGINMKDLAEQLCVTGGAVTQFIDELVSKKLIVREHSADDRRSVKVRLTDEAREHFKTFKQEYLKTITPRFAHLSEEELRTLIKLLDKISLN